jgi:hypothetical protein
MHIGYWWGSQKEGDHYEDQDVDGWTILKYRDRMEWCGLVRSGSGYRPVEGSCEHGDEPVGSMNAGKFLGGCTIGGF